MIYAKKYSAQSTNTPKALPPKRVLQQATCAAILAASFAAPLAASDSQVSTATTTASLLASSCLALKDATIQILQKYCASSWRQAGILQHDWEDCTQDVVVELLSRLSPQRAATAIEEANSPDRRELVRCIWCVAQRWRRAQGKQCTSLDQVGEVEQVGGGTDFEQGNDWETLEPALERLSGTQQQILNQLREGYSVAEVAEKLDLTPARVSDQKYKAIKKLQKVLAV